MNFRKWPRLSIVIISLSLLSLLSCTSAQKIDDQLTFGVIADCQYCDAKTKGARNYSLSDSKLKDAVEHLNTMSLDYVIHLGDLVDRDFRSYDVVLPIFNSLTAPKYHVLGNHEYSVADEFKSQIPSKLGMTSNYYDFQVKGWRFVVMDGNDISFYAYPKNSKKYEEVLEYYKQNKIKAPKWNGAIGGEQLSWLEDVLNQAAKEDEKVVIYCHFPVYPQDPKHNLWNANEVVQLLEKYDCVKAYINGHNHHGSYGVKKGIHYLTFQGMVDTKENTFGTVKVFADRLELTGYGREPSREMILR